MRKLLTLLCVLAVAAPGLMCSCGDGRGASASDRADRLVREWDAAALNLYRYSGRDVVYDGRDGYMVVMTPDADSFADGEALRDYQAEETVRQCAGPVYGQLAACFGGEGEACIIVAVCDGDGRVVFTFLNGVLQ